MANKWDYQDKLAFVNMTITTGEATTPTDGVDLIGMSLVGVFIPSTFDGTAITLTACNTQGGTYLPVYDKAGNAYTITTAASRYVYFNPADFAGIRFIKFVTGTSQTTTSTVFVLVLAPVLVEK